jgi:hypothetical protein
VSRPAIGLVGRIAAVAVVLWFALASLVQRDSYLTRVGRVWEIEFAWVHAEQFDRAAECGDRPAVYVVGSSITRDAFDADLLASELRQRGRDACVRKFAFGSGAPLFTRAMARKLDIRRGDLVVTSVAVDNFRLKWLDHFKSADKYVQFAIPPGDIWGIDELSFADRLEYSLSWFPPRGFFQYQGSFQNGVHRWLEAWFLTGEPPAIPDRFEDDPYDHRHRDPRFRETPRTFRLTKPIFDLSSTQTNIAALAAWSREMTARGAVPWVVYVPPHPEYDPKYLAKGLADEMHAWMAANLPYYARLQALPDEAYIDYKHPNDVGRPLLTSELADLVAWDWHPTPPR